MNFEWVAIALGDVLWISMAFALGLAARGVGLPPLIGYLAAGFALNMLGFAGGETMAKLADLGITLLLFTVGLKLNLRTFARPQVWAVTSLHIAAVVVMIALLLAFLALAQVPVFDELGVTQVILIAFALSFSSTVFVVKMLEDKGEMASLYGRIAIGILIVQDIAAVLFLAFSVGKWPSWWALLLFALIPLRHVFERVLEWVGHSELLVLYGLLLALGGAEVFELAGVKGDLGALVLGVVLANHAKGEELGKLMLGFKDLFLLGFFLSIGFAGQFTTEALFIAVLLTPLIFVKSALFFLLLTAFRMRARTAILSSLSLTNFSEFGLIVASIAVANSWLPAEWLVILSVALALSFTIAAWLNMRAQTLFARFRSLWLRAQRGQRLPDDRPLRIDDSRIAVIGMGGVGTGAFDTLAGIYQSDVIGIDIDAVTVRSHRENGRSVVQGDPSDADFWDRVSRANSLEIVLLALPKVKTCIAVLNQLNDSEFDGEVAAIARYPDEEAMLREAGVQSVFNIYTEAGVGFASHVRTTLLDARALERASDP